MTALGTLGMIWAQRNSGRVIGSLIAELKKPLRDAASLAGWGFAIAVPAAGAVFFFLFAAFIWAERTYGIVEASLLLGTLFLGITAAILITWLIYRRRKLNRSRRVNNVHGLSDPMIIAAGLELVRMAGVGRIIPVVALGALIIGALESDRNARA